MRVDRRLRLGDRRRQEEGIRSPFQVVWRKNATGMEGENHELQAMYGSMWLNEHHDGIRAGAGGSITASSNEVERMNEKRFGLDGLQYYDIYFALDPEQSISIQSRIFSCCPAEAECSVLANPVAFFDTMLAQAEVVQEARSLPAFLRGLRGNPSLRAGSSTWITLQPAASRSATSSDMANAIWKACRRVVRGESRSFSSVTMPTTVGSNYTHP